MKISGSECQFFFCTVYLIVVCLFKAIPGNTLNKDNSVLNGWCFVVLSWPSQLPPSKLHYQQKQGVVNTVDGRNPGPPWDGAKALQIMGYLPYQLVSRISEPSTVAGLIQGQGVQLWGQSYEQVPQRVFAGWFSVVWYLQVRKSYRPSFFGLFLYIFCLYQ